MKLSDEIIEAIVEEFETLAPKGSGVWSTKDETRENILATEFLEEHKYIREAHERSLYLN